MFYDTTIQLVYKVDKQERFEKEVHVHLSHVWTLIGVFRVPFCRYPGVPRDTMFQMSECLKGVLGRVGKLWEMDRSLGKAGYYCLGFIIVYEKKMKIASFPIKRFFW